MIRLQEGLRVLLIESRQEDKNYFCELLQAGKIEMTNFTWVKNIEAAVQEVKINLPDILFSAIPFNQNLAADIELIALISNANTPLVMISSTDEDDNGRHDTIDHPHDRLFKKDLSSVLLKKSIGYGLDRAKTGAQLKEIIERFDLLAKATNDIVWDWELTKRRALWMGNGLESSLGYNQRTKKVDADFWEKGLHPEDKERVTKKLNLIFQEALHNKWEDEYRFKTQSGEYKIFYDRGYIIYEDGKPVRMIGTMEDITTRVLLERKLEQESLLKQKHIAEAAVTAQEKERTEIGKELHDNVNQLLSASKLYIDAAANDIANNAQLLGQASGFIKNAIEEIRALSKVLHAPLITELGLCESINNLSNDIMMVNELQINIDHSDFTEEGLNENFKLTIYRIIQEQLTNILKHARATKSNILLSTNENDIYLEVNDNGIGFDISKKRQGIGLSNIQSRVSMYEGTVEVFSGPEKGSKLSVKFPLSEAALTV
ncbi:MAG: PAS domain S-box protein [Chitinophagaceae bacterium]|nr:MAG: PAS domain S-box protein [Chitinophagaceae bacterium]